MSGIIIGAANSSTISESERKRIARERALQALNSLTVTTITPDKAVDEWGMIEGLIADYGRMHAEELKVFLHGVKMVRSSQKNNTASNASKTMRHALCLPQELMVLLKRYVPDLFTDKKKMRKFMKKFPGFCVPENI